MSLQPIQKKKSINEIQAGVHLLVISDMSLLKFPDGQIHKIDGFPAIVVQYKDGKNQIHEQLYVIDGDFRQKSFDKMLQAAQVPMASGTPKKADAVGKRLWAAIREVHYIDDDVVIKDTFTGKDKIEHYIFKVYPLIEGAKKPRILGDPEDNEGIPTQEFLTYNNVSKKEFVDEMQPYQGAETKNITFEEKAPLPAKPAVEEEEEMPMFDEEPKITLPIMKPGETLSVKNKGNNTVTVDTTAVPSGKTLTYPSDDEVPNF